MTPGPELAELQTYAIDLALGAGRIQLDGLSSTPEVAENLSGEALARVLEPGRYLGATDAFIDRALANEATPSTGTGS